MINTSKIFIKRTAKLSKCQKYRYLLGRNWDAALPKLLFIGLNPSTADAKIDDPTIRKCIRLCQRWNYGSFNMLNLFAYRTADPKELKRVEDPIGKRNDAYLRKWIKASDKVVLMWGNHGSFLNRDVQVMQFLEEAYCLKVNKNGSPAHLLYIKENETLKLYNLKTVINE